nr:hypothetical protein [Rickettsia tamurae]
MDNNGNAAYTLGTANHRLKQLTFPVPVMGLSI